METSIWKSLYTRLSEYKANCKYDDLYRDIEPEKPLRLSGGTGSEDASLSPFVACKGILDQFDNIIASYKRTVGPCGQGTCPYSVNMSEKACKKDTIKTVNEEEPIQIMSCTDISCPFSLPDNKALYNNLGFVDESVPLNYCGMTECPFAQRNTVRKDTQVQAACGSPKCAFTKLKIGLIDDDALEQVNQLPAPKSGYCGLPSCKSPVIEPSLPPIHWDCPEPLPKGACKNPNCPFLPADLKVLQKLVKYKGTCESPSCTNVLPDLAKICENPDCPYEEGSESNNSSETSVTGVFTVCENPTCPHQTSKPNPLEDEYCGHPVCPFAPKTAKKVKKTCDEDMDSVCSILDCPFNELKKITNRNSKECTNPNCPSKAFDYNNSNTPNNTTDCSNPNCPNKAIDCNNPDCPNKSINKNSGNNNSCSFSQKSKKRVSYADDACSIQPKSRVREPCDNPQCPYSKTNQECSSERVCSNPDCPFASNKAQVGSLTCKGQSVVCDNPDCPFTNQPRPCVCDIGDVCSNPMCQFAAKSLDPCADPRNICKNPNCPYAVELTNQETSGDVVSQGPCAEEQTCGSPDCPFANIKPERDSLCGNPDCPYQYYSSNKGKTGEEGEDSLVCKVPCDYDAVCDNPECPLQPPPERLSKGSQRRSTVSNSKAKRTSNISQSQVRQSQEKAEPGKKTGKKTKRRSRIPGFQGSKIGHRDCLTPEFNVPKNMGWLWTLNDPLCCRRRGFRPGAVDKKVAKIIFKHKKMKAAQDRLDDFYIAEKKQTLTVTKKQGEYNITVNPLKEPKSLRYRNESVYMDCTPMKFKIKKNKEPIDYTSCICDDEEVHDTTSSDSFEVVFSPTGSRKNPAFFETKKPGKAVDTQYDKKDIKTNKKEAGKKGGKKGGGGKKGKKKK